MRTPIAALVAMLGWVYSVHPGSVKAQCVTVPASVSELRECDEDGVRYWSVRTDLSAGDAGLRVSRPMERGETLDSWAAVIPGAAVVISAGGFRFPSYVPDGLTVGAGEAWSETMDDSSLSVVGFDERNVGIVVPPAQVVPAESWMHNVFSGVSVLRSGVPVPCAGDGCVRTSRTAAGLSEDGRFFVSIVAEGDRPGSLGVTDEELGLLLSAAGAYHGVRSGAGATSALWVEGETVSESSDGALRPGAALVAVLDRASGVTTKVQGVVGIEGMPDEFLPDSTLVVETIDGRVVATGAPVTARAFWEFTVPVGEYIVRASHPGYQTGCKVCVGVAGEDVWCSVFLVMGEGAETCTAPDRTLDVGPWPEGPTPVDAGIDAGARSDAGAMDGGGGCAATNGTGTTGTKGSGIFALLWVGWRRRR